jgi:beta-lactamase regulating signal transducer with metallopeptidase domain
VALAWGTWLGLIALALLTALPHWPRLALISNSYRAAAEAIQPPRELILLAPEPAASIESVHATTVDALAPVASLRPAGVLGWPDALAIGWLAVAGLVTAWITIGLAQTWRLIRASESAPAWIEDEIATLVGRQRPAPGVRISRRLTTAAAVGSLAPRILLPKAAECRSQQRIVRAALAHEWAHIRHGDLLLLAVERLLLPLLAWQPLWWWLRRGVRQDLELLADAAAAGDEPVEYAEALVAWAKSATAAPAGLAALSLWESPHTLSRRVTMLLDPKRTPAPPAGRGWQVLLILSVIGVIAGLSSFTLRPHSAVGQESARPATSPASAANGPAMIALQCYILEADRDELSEVLPVVEKRWQPDPQTDITLQEPHQWLDRLKILTSKKGTTVLSRPQIQTLDGQVAVVQIGGEALPPVAADDNAPAAPEAAKPTEFGLRIHVTPRLTRVPRNPGLPHVTLSVDVKQGDFKGDYYPFLEAGPVALVERSIASEAVVPVGQTVVFAHRPEKAGARSLVLAIQVFQPTSADQSAVGPRPIPQARELRQISLQSLRKLLEEAQQAADEPGDVSEQQLRALLEQLKALTQVESAGKAEPAAPPVDLQRLVSDLQHELLKRTREAEAQRSHSAALQAQVEALQAQLAGLQGGTPEVQTFNLKYAAASKVSEVLKTYLEQLQQHSGDLRIAEIKVTPNVRLNAVHVSGPSKYFASVSAIVDKLDLREPRASGTAANSDLAATPATALPAVDRQTQVELMKLDLQEAEIGLRAAQKDMESVQVLREKGVIGQGEIAKRELQLQSAEIKVMRAKILLEGAMRQLAPPAASQPATEGANPKPLPRTGR